MDRDFEIKKGDDGLLYQMFNGKKYKLYPKEKYFSRGTVRMHIAVWKYYNGDPKPKFHIHHKDGDSKNNKINNLEQIEAKLHLSKHAKKRFAENKEFVKRFQQRGIESAKEWHRSEEGRKWHSKHAREIYKRREYVTKQYQHCGKDYQTRDPKKSKYCHQNCKAKARRKRERESRTSL